jgi:hypothetical protein
MAGPHNLPPPPSAGIRVSEGVFSTPQKAALASFPNTLALHEAWSVDGALHQAERIVRNPQRSYCTAGEGSEQKAHERVMLALMGVRTVGQQDSVDQHTGWPKRPRYAIFNPLHL